MPSGNQSDSDDSVIIVPYVKPKPPEIVLDSDDEDQPPKNAALTRKAVVQEEATVQVDSVTVQSVPVVIQEKSKTVVDEIGVLAATPRTSKSKRATNKTNSAKKDSGKSSTANKDLRKGKKKSLDKKTKAKSPAKNVAVADSSKSSDDAAGNGGKKKRKSRTETVSVDNGSVESDPSAKVPPKRRKKDSETIDPSQAAAVDHFRFMQQLNLFPEDAPEPKVRKSKKKGASSSAVISAEEIEALNAQISFDIQNNPIRIRPLEAIADDSSLCSFDSSTPANATIEPTQEIAVADGSIGFVSVTEEKTGKLRKKRSKELVQTVVPVPKDKLSPPSDEVVAVPEVEESQTHPGLSKVDKKKVKTNAETKLTKAVKQKNKKGKERPEKQQGGEKQTELPGSNDAVWTTSEEEDNITTAELQAVQSSITLNVGDGRSRLTVDQMREHAMRKSKPDPSKPRIFDPSLESHGTKRSASPSGLPPAKARTVGTPRARTRQVVQEIPDIDIPWDVSEEGQLEDRSFPNTWSRRMMEFYGGITKDSIDLEGVWRIQDTSPHLWKIREELERSGMRSKKTRHLKCINCKMFGDHLSKDCPRNKRKRSCFMCGDSERAHHTEQFYRSNHTASAISTICPMASCLHCGQKLPGKFMQRCRKCGPLFKSQNQKCSTCKLQGHKVNTCPDNWRRFHSITNEAQLLDPVITKSAVEVKYKRQKHSYCPNCGQKGHSYFECQSRRQVNQWYSPAHPMIHGEPSLEALDGTSHPVAHVMPLRTSRQTLSTSTQRIAPKAPVPAKSNAMTQKKTQSRCECLPDCKNVDSEFCYKIGIIHKEHKKLIKMNDELMFIEKINSSYNSQEVVVSLLRKRAEIHVGGTHYFRLRRRMREFIEKLKQEPGATIHDLLPEFYPPPSSPARAFDSSPEVIEIVDSLEEQATAVPLVTIDDEDDDVNVVSLPPTHRTRTEDFVKPKRAQEQRNSSSTESQAPGVVNPPEKPTEQIGVFSGGFVNIEGEKRDACPSKKNHLSFNVQTEERNTRSKEMQCTVGSDKRNAVVDKNTERPSDKQNAYELRSTPQSTVVTNNLGAELYLLNKKASSIVGRISAQIRTARRSVEESVQPSSTTSPKEDDSLEAINRSSAPEAFERYSGSVSSSTDVPKSTGSAFRRSTTSSPGTVGSAKELEGVSSTRSHRLSDPEILYDRRKRSPRQASQQSQTDRAFESIRYGEGNPINFRDIDERPALQAGNVWTSAVQDSQNRQPPSVFSSPHAIHAGTPQMPMNISPPLMQNWPMEGNNYGPYPYDQNQYINPFFQQPHPQQMMGGWQNMQPNDNHPFVQDSYANMVIQQQHDFYVPPPQQFHPTGPGPNLMHPNSSGNYRFDEDPQHYKNQQFHRGRGRGGYVKRPRGANRWVRPTR